MQNENIQTMIERYKRELMEFEKQQGSKGTRAVSVAMPTAIPSPLPQSEPMSPPMPADGSVTEAAPMTAPEPAPTPQPGPMTEPAPAPTPTPQPGLVTEPEPAPTLPSFPLPAPMTAPEPMRPITQPGENMSATSPMSGQRATPAPNIPPRKANPKPSGKKYPNYERRSVTPPANTVSVDAFPDEPAFPTVAPLESEVERFDTQGNIYPPYNNMNEKEYETYEDLLRDNPKTGTLRVQVFVGDQLFPISNARVVILRRINGNDYTFYDEQTDSSGVVYGLTLATPDKNLSEYPTALMPFATYNVWVEHPNYLRAYYIGVMMFDGIETIQNVALIPESSAQNKNIIKIFTKSGVTDYTMEQEG